MLKTLNLNNPFTTLNNARQNNSFKKKHKEIQLNKTRLENNNRMYRCYALYTYGRK